MNGDRRPESETPESAARELVDDRGRRWTGMIASGRMGGGEEYAEVIFACEDNPSELKRVSRLNEPPARASDAWRGMDESGMRDVFDRSMPA